jgi:hypothetical protein
MAVLRLRDISDPKLLKRLMEAGQLSPGEAKKQRAKRRELEAVEQKKVIAWAWDQQRVKRYPALAWLHASANGSKRDGFTAWQLQEEGVLSGVSDLCLPFPAGGYHGLYIEMKSSITGGKPSPNQIKFMNWVRSVGYCVAVSYDAEPAKKLLRWYVRGAVGLPPTPLWQGSVS